MDIKPHPSPNFGCRPNDQPPRYIVLHYTGMRTWADALARMCDPAAQVSAHYAIPTTGACYELVAPSARAWHAGLGAWQNETNLNDVSIGIELENPGLDWGYTPFPKPQISTLVTLLHHLQHRYAIAPQQVIGHSDLAQTRKEDPGHLFPWHTLARKGVAFWPDMPITCLPTPLSSTELTHALHHIGYDVTHNSLAACLRAFCQRFVQSYTSFNSLSPDTPYTVFSKDPNYGWVSTRAQQIATAT
jgi:N-acetylmuramoyl-L-alanine amidase